MTKAIWNDTVIAESDQTILVEGNHYFPSDSIKPEYFRVKLDILTIVLFLSDNKNE